MFLLMQGSNTRTAKIPLTRRCCLIAGMECLHNYRLKIHACHHCTAQTHFVQCKQGLGWWITPQTGTGSVSCLSEGFELHLQFLETCCTMLIVPLGSDNPCTGHQSCARYLLSAGDDSTILITGSDFMRYISITSGSSMTASGQLVALPWDQTSPSAMGGISI